MATIKVLHGPNLNLLGQREPGVYSSDNLMAINDKLQTTALEYKINLEIFQTNSESKLIELIHTAVSNTDFIVINPAAFAHTSVALRDALLATKIPFIEVHISNIFAREKFRHHSYLADVANGIITGVGSYGYTAALMAAIQYLNQSELLEN